MNPQTGELSPRQSLDLITSMIMEAKGKIQRNNFYFLLWGWVVVTANLGMFILAEIGYRYPYVVWTITIPAWIYTIYRSFRQGRSAATSTHFDVISGWLWISYGITIFILVAFGFKINYQLNAVIVTVSAIPTMVSGVILRFRPLIIGGAGFWLSGIIIFLIPESYQPLVSAAAIAGGYLVPGYMLKRTNTQDV